MSKIDEIWKDVPGYEGLYQVSNLGRVRSLDRVIVYSNRVSHKYKGKLRTPQLNSKGYLYIMFGRKDRHFIHRLVATSFVSNPNPSGFTIVNHIDENPLNNVSSNLEWCDQKYNLNYGSRAKKYSRSRSKEVALLSEDGTIEKIYASAETAGKDVGIHRAYIRRACEGYQKTAKGRRWKYTNP